ncbi:MAG: T9SS type A sorting domain-containing protein [bacterium]|nr:T9SS type A sorting domain-containing protein [bacterium]
MNYEPGGKLVMYGAFWGGVGNISDVLRIYEDGSLDNTWQFMGTGASTSFDFVKYLNNVYIIRNISWVSLSKFNNYGQETDTAWYHNIDRGNICGEFWRPYFFSDGSMLVGTDSICNIVSDKKRWFMRFLPDGNVDTNFKHSPNGDVFDVIKYSSDKLLLYGGGMRGFTKYDNIPAFRLCRIDTLGNLDTTFHSIFTSGTPHPVYVQNDGKIIVCGQIGNPAVLRFIRLNADGSLDSTFNNFNSAIGDAVVAVCPTTDGGYLIGGQFRQYQGYTRNNIAKIDANGFIDTTYFNGLGIDSVFGFPGATPYVNSIVKGVNDNYYVMGRFWYYNGVKVNPIIRIQGLSVGINEVEKEKGKIKVFPNPAANEVNLSFSTPINDCLIELYDISGMKIKEVYLTNVNNNCKLSTEELSSGFYMFSIKNNKGTIGKAKLLIVR